MNVKAIAKRERLVVTIDWKDGLKSIPFNHIKLWDIADIIMTYWNKKSVKEVAVVKYFGMQIYFSVRREDFRTILEWIKERLEKAEQYEWCARIQRTLTETYGNTKSNANNGIHI